VVLRGGGILPLCRVLEYDLGGMYNNGRGIPQAYLLAHMWSHLVAAQGQESTIRNRDVVAKIMTREQIAEAKKLAQEWTPKE